MMNAYTIMFNHNNRNWLNQFREWW